MIYRYFVLFIFTIFQITFSQDFWEQTNGPFGGAIISFAISANNDLYVGTTESGVFHSNNDGLNWLPTNNGINSGGWINTLITNSEGHIFAGTDNL